MKEEKEGEPKTASLRETVKHWLANLFSLFVIYSMATLRVQELQQLSIFLSFILALPFFNIL